ncbi:MAG: penicillin-binding protein [Deltaproteobacteria bacterium]|nr:penicillin-binding protein [Deltaproteobacteria bacterium]
MGLVALSASGNEPSAAPAIGPDPAAKALSAPSADGGNVEPSVAAERSPAEGAGEGPEGEVAEFATFPVPSFAALAPIPRDADYLANARLKGGKLVVEPSADAQQSAEPIVLTVDPQLQKRLIELLKSYVVPYGAIAAIEPATGRILALAEHSQDAPAMRGLPLKAVYPAASVFKIVTGAALLSEGVPAEERVCFHGGKRRLAPKLLEDSRRDGRCVTLEEAMGHSLNVPFAKLAKRKLDAKALRGWAEQFGFNAPLAFAEPADVSVARIPDGGFEMAKTAAGFGEVFLSPLHGALIAATIGNKGVMMSPVLFAGQDSQARRVVAEPIARQLADMLEKTVTEGTARSAFRERGRYALGTQRAAGKTGSLSDKKPFRDFSWFVGWAPKDDPKIAVAAVVANGPLWRVRAPYLGREALRMYLEGASAPEAKGRAARKVRGQR